MGIFTCREAIDPAIDLSCMLTWPWAVTEASMEFVIPNVLCCVCAGSEQPVLSGLSSQKSEFLGTSEFQLAEGRKAT